jgi:hypothetical protein
MLSCKRGDFPEHARWLEGCLGFCVTFPREAMELIKLLSKGGSSYP